MAMFNSYVSLAEDNHEKYLGKVLHIPNLKET
jgi:hypothetical protein